MVSNGRAKRLSLLRRRRLAARRVLRRRGTRVRGRLRRVARSI